MVKRTFSYRGLAPLQSIVAAIRSTDPDLLVSGDDLATGHLHSLHAQEIRAHGASSPIADLIERSIGAPEYFPTIDDRASFMRIAAEAGARIPQTATIKNVESLEQWMAQAGFPTVLKANGTSGGVGVRVVNNTEQALRAFRNLQAPPLLARAAKRAIFDRDTTLVLPSLLRARSAVTAQAFIAGTEATSAVACWKGEVLASLHFEVLQKTGSAGHATVLRRIAHPEMAASAETVVRRLQLSGLNGFDFMMDREFRKAYLIEINPRATQVGHLSLGGGQDLPAALVAAIGGTPAKPSPAITQNEVIALFPQELSRDPGSDYIRSGYHDVPQDQPELLRACLRKRAEWGLFGLLQRYRSDR
jgi:hypothetical protein